MSAVRASRGRVVHGKPADAGHELGAVDERKAFTRIQEDRVQARGGKRLPRRSCERRGRTLPPCR